MWRNTRTSFGLGAIALHWSVAVAVTAAFAVGWATRETADDPALQFALFQWHKSFGFLALALAAARIGYALASVRPGPVPGTPRFQRTAARVVHAGLLTLTLAVPIAGWVVASASPLAIPSLVFDLVLVPHLPLPKSEPVESAAAEIHMVLAWAMAALVALHAGAALVHAVVLRDGTLRRMLPGDRAGRADGD